MLKRQRQKTQLVMVKTTEQQNKTVKYQTNDPQTLPKTELQDGSGYG